MSVHVIGKSHTRDQNFYQGQGFSSPWLKFRPQGEIDLVRVLPLTEVANEMLEQSIMSGHA